MNPPESGTIARERRIDRLMRKAIEEQRKGKLSVSCTRWISGCDDAGSDRSEERPQPRRREVVRHGGQDPGKANVGAAHAVVSLTLMNS